LVPRLGSLFAALGALRINDIVFALADLRFRAKAIRLAWKGKGPLLAHLALSATTAFSLFPPVHRANVECVLRVDFVL
jgi:hypothetical protein